MPEKKAIVFVNGEITDYTWAASLIQPEETIFCVDGGTRHALHLGLHPTYVIGDLDSIEPQTINVLETRGVQIHRFPTHKNETDLELALDFVITLGFKTIRLLGMFGGRLDQELGNIFQLSANKFSVADIRCLDEHQEVFIIRNTAEITGAPGDIVSLLPLTPEVTGVITEEMAYPLRAETLYFEKTRGISNQMITGRARVNISAGILLCIHSLSINPKG